MKVYKMTERKVIESHKVLDKTLCDICKCEIIKESYQTAEATIKLKSGTCYPEGSTGEETYINICEDCFITKIIPLIEKQFNIKFQTDDYCY